MWQHQCGHAVTVIRRVHAVRGYKQVHVPQRPRRIAILPCAPGPPCCGLQSCREWQSRVRRVLFLCAPSRRLRKAIIISSNSSIIMSPIVVGDTAGTRSTHIYELIASSRCVCGVDTTFGDASFCTTGRRGRLRRWGALVCRWCKSIL